MNLFRREKRGDEPHVRRRPAYNGAISAKALNDIFDGCSDFQSRDIRPGLSGERTLFVCWLDGVASGGEISRIMLAMKAISAENEGVDTMIFDEIDTGVSGRMAQTVGEKMCALGRSRQVICVTHLAQIAALGDSQYLVEKTVKDGHTGSSVRRLDEEGRVGELARLVGGADDSASGREHARSMLAAAEALKKKRF